MSELTTWLLDRIAEDEAVTMTSSNGSGATWTEPKYVLHDHDCMFLWAVEPSDRTCECDGEKRWLAECEAKRRIVKRACSPRQERRPTNVPGRYDVVTVWEPMDEVDGDAIVLALASVYAGAPGWREEWAL